MKSKDPYNLSIKNLDIPCWEDREKHFKWLWHVVNGLSELSFPSLSDKKIFLIKVRSDMDDKYLNDSYPELLYVNGSDAVKEKRMKELEDPYLRDQLVKAFRKFYSEFVRDRINRKIETLDKLIQAHLEKQILEKVDQKQKNNKPTKDSKIEKVKSFKPSNDFRIVTVNGTKFEFNERQAAIIERMHELHNQDYEEVTKNDILSVINYSQSPGIRDSFKNTPAWKTFIYYSRKGHYKHFKLFYNLRSKK